MRNKSNKFSAFGDLEEEDWRMPGEYTKEEWEKVYRKFRPDDTTEEYDVAWAEFQKAKAEHLAKLRTP